MEVGTRGDLTRNLLVGLESKVGVWGTVSRKGRLWSNGGGPEITG